MTEFTPNHTQPQRLLNTCPVYKETPLTSINLIADIDIFIKDESHRMNLGSFKALGGVYAVATLLADKWFKFSGEKLTLEQYTSIEFKKFSSLTTFICASAGNHGLAVASGAKIFGAKAKIHLSSEVPKEFEKRLTEQTAVVVRSGNTYEESVDAAIADADTTGGVLLADGSWQGYTYAPSLVMEGYTVIASELKNKFTNIKKWPSHVFIQAGVGGLAASMAFMIRQHWEQQPEIIIVEPEFAPCLQTSHQNGISTPVEGAVSIMGRLDCKIPSLVAFEALEKAQVNYLTISDKESIDATRILKENNIDTTPSGAAGLAGLLKVYEQNKGDIIVSKNNFKPLIIVTEKQL
jgi:diaminopropionate ammonia-lyase